jgi:hypothetical protein
MSPEILTTKEIQFQLYTGQIFEHLKQLTIQLICVIWAVIKILETQNIFLIF